MAAAGTGKHKDGLKQSCCAVHLTGLVEFAGQYAPTGHRMGRDAPAGQYEPQGHSIGMHSPDVGQWLPATHCVGLDLCLYSPCLHKEMDMFIDGSISG